MKKVSPFIYIIIVFIIAFLPVISFVFALKNDFFLGYFPPKYLLSETIRSGQFPLWNPYIAFGLPFYADMNGAYWNPITWLISLTTGYTAYTITLELLLYVLLGGIGMYKLAGELSDNKQIRLIAAISYLCNGFVIGHLQHLNWISCSAFLPWCVWGVFIINRNATLKNILVTILVFYLMLSSSHPGMIISAIYFFPALVLFLLYQRYRKEGILSMFKGIKVYTFFFALLLLLSAGLIAGYADIIPHFVRNSKVDLSLSLSENTNIQSWISLLLPFSTVKNKLLFENDIALRNNYFGLLLFVFFILSFFITKTRAQLFFLFAGIFFFLLSLGGVIKLFALNFLPLLGYVRINGEFRIFAIICFIILATSCFQTSLTDFKKLKPKLKFIFSFLISICLMLICYSLYQIYQGNSLWSVKETLNNVSWRDGLKSFVEKLSFPDTILLQSIIQIPILFLLWKKLNQARFKFVVIISFVDLILATLFNMPFTGVGKVSVEKIYRIHERAPHGIIMPKVQPLIFNDTIPNKDSALVGDWSFYNKQIGKAKPVFYPVKLTNNYLFYHQLIKDSSISVSNNSFVFLSSDISKPVIKQLENLKQEDLITYTTNDIRLHFISRDNGYLVLLQNYYPHWYYNTEDNVKRNVLKAGINFIAVPVKKGENNIRIFFNPLAIKILIVFSLVLLILMISLLFFPVSKRIFFS